MNLWNQGAHACADWLLYKLRAARGGIALHIEDDGDLTVREARRDRGGPSLVGVYRAPLNYCQLVDDLSWLRQAEAASR